MHYLLTSKSIIKKASHHKQISERATLPQEEPQANPSGGVPALGLVLKGNDSSMSVTVPGHLPVGQDVEVKTVMLMILILWRPRLICVFVS